MKFSNVVEPITVNKPTDDICLEISKILVILDFTGFASTVTHFYRIREEVVQGAPPPLI